MIEYPQSTTPVAELEPMRGVELVYFVIPEASLWSVVHVMFELEGPLDLDVLKHRVAQRYAQFERLCQRPVKVGKQFYWETTGPIEIEHHIHVVPDGVAGTRDQLQTWLGGLLTTPLNPTRPLWEVRYIPDYEGRAAVILRIHHAYGDGRSLQTIATGILAASVAESLQRLESPSTLVRHKAVADAIRQPSARRITYPQNEGVIQRWIRRIRIRLRGIAKAFSAFRKDHDTGFTLQPSDAKVLAFSRPMSRSKLRAAATSIQCTLNDLVLAGVSGAMRRHLASLGQDPDQTRMTVSIPVDLHSPRSLAQMHKQGVLTNHLGTISIRLPVGLEDGAARAAAIATAMRESMEAGEPLMQYKSFSSFHRMPQGLLIRMFRSQAHKQSGIISNLSGPKDPMYLAGRRIHAWYFWVIASQLAGSHLGVSITQYQDDVRLGLTLPANTGYDARALVEAMAAETEGLITAATVPA